MTDKIYCDPHRRHDFVLLFDVADGNPNGDPDAGNLPRVDPETMQGLVTDVCIKRKVRNWVDMTRGTEERMKIYIQNQGIALNDLHERAWAAVADRGGTPGVDEGRKYMCANFYDIRMFGAVMTVGEKSCGQVRGPVQFTFARSINPIIPMEVAITRMAVTRTEDLEKERTMGRKALVPYGLYLGYGFVNPKLGEQTGMTADDLNLLWEALIRSWEVDRSASRGRMACRGLYVFTHDDPLGKAPAHLLQERVQAQLKPGVATPRSFRDYALTVNTQHLPDGVVLTNLVPAAL